MIEYILSLKRLVDKWMTVLVEEIVWMKNV